MCWSIRKMQWRRLFEIHLSIGLRFLYGLSSKYWIRIDASHRIWRQSRPLKVIWNRNTSIDELELSWTNILEMQNQELLSSYSLTLHPTGSSLISDIDLHQNQWDSSYGWGLNKQQSGLAGCIHMLALPITRMESAAAYAGGHNNHTLCDNWYGHITWSIRHNGQKHALQDVHVFSGIETFCISNRSFYKSSSMFVQ